MILRLCLKDKSSVLIRHNSLRELQVELTDRPFIMVENYNTGKMELYNRNHIWCVRVSSQNTEATNE